jgi:hypothetical protein
MYAGNRSGVPRSEYRFPHYWSCRTVPLAAAALRFSYPRALSGNAIGCRNAPVASAHLSFAIAGFGSAPVPTVPTTEVPCGMDLLRALSR